MSRLEADIFSMERGKEEEESIDDDDDELPESASQHYRSQVAAKKVTEGYSLTLAM